MSKFVDFLLAGLCILLIGAIIFAGVYEATRTEVEVYTVGCEVSQIAYAEEAVSRSSTRPTYKMGVRNDDFATTLEITAEQFAKYTIGDVIEVQVTIYEYMDGVQEYEYKLVK